ncbi:MAG: adenylate/guanylate cyclase domain-containing protein [Acidimicrobiales bacterium]
MGLLIHAVTYVAVNALLILIWAVFSTDDFGIGDAVRSPIDAVRNHGFWPMWVIASWGVLLAIHAAVAVQVARIRQRRRRIARRRSRVRAVRAARGALPDATPEQKAVTTGRHWVVAMFTDVVGSTGLAEALGDEEWSAVIAEHRRLIRELVAAHGGSEVGTQGDGFLVRFARPASAVACAVEVQRRFEQEREAGRFTPQVRIGLHAGEVVGSEDGDLIGRMLNTASRVTSVGGPGEIVVTEPVADELGPDVALDDRGLHTLKGVDRPRHVLAVRWRDELPLADELIRHPEPDR